MASQRVFQLGLRRMATPSFRVQTAGRLIQRRFAATQSANESATDILAKQRLRRPVSPHISIYKPQITWFGSGLNRLTAVIIGAGFYLTGFAYLAAPTLGWHMESPSMIAAVAAWPVWVKISTKLAIGMPFFYHSVNGLRHLAWDVGVGFANKTVMQTGWAAVGASAALTLYYAFFS